MVHPWRPAGTWPSCPFPSVLGQERRPWWPSLWPRLAPDSLPVRCHPPGPIWSAGPDWAGEEGGGGAASPSAILPGGRVVSVCSLGWWGCQRFPLALSHKDSPPPRRPRTRRAPPTRAKTHLLSGSPFPSSNSVRGSCWPKEAPCRRPGPSEACITGTSSLSLPSRGPMTRGPCPNTVSWPLPCMSWAHSSFHGLPSLLSAGAARPYWGL